MNPSEQQKHTIVTQTLTERLGVVEELTEALDARVVEVARTALAAFDDLHQAQQRDLAGLQQQLATLGRVLSVVEQAQAAYEQRTRWQRLRSFILGGR